MAGILGWVGGGKRGGNVRAKERGDSSGKPT